MTVFLGIDVGAIGVKAALLLPKTLAPQVLAAAASTTLRLRAVTVANREDVAVLVAEARRTRGRPLDVTRDLFTELLACVDVDQIGGLRLTGSGGGLLADVLDAATCNEFQACARGIDLLHPHVRTVFEIGGESSRYIRLEPDPGGGALGILDYSNNGDCAAGTGAFLDQQAGRLKYAVEEIGEIVGKAERAAQIAGRCSVFAKSDMIHAQQKGYAPAEVLRGLCNAVATNYKSAIVKGRTPEPPIAFVGGVAANSAVVASLRETFGVDERALFVPEAADSIAAIGAAVIASDTPADERATLQLELERFCEGTIARKYDFTTSRPLSLDNVRLLRDRVRPYTFPTGGVVDAYLGLDIGSVGTKLVLIDEDGEVIHYIFTRTEGRPIEVVSRCLRETEEAVGWGIRIRGVGTTGSGRELVGELVGADSINDEITAHKTGATFIGDRLLGKRPDTIFEIGGQDSKYICLQTEESGSDGATKRRSDGEHTSGGTAVSAATGSNKEYGPETQAAHVDSIVVDFTMNEACAAGTGSFLEERAEELGVSIKGEFAELALSSESPVKLGERCTVFMERDVNTYMQRGARREDIIAGLAYSIGYNYINRVVRGRPIGDCIFFQGGTAYNDAVAAAFSMITGKEIIVPPHNAILGAIGAALLAKERITETGASTRFRGYDMEQVDYTLREFTCHACSNTCSIQAFDVEGEKTFWGDKCSDRFRKQTKIDREPAIPDLVALRSELLYEDDCDDPPDATATVGVPLAMYTYDFLPLWRRFFHDCGMKVVLSRETNRQIVHHGLDASVAEPCFPIIVAHGHAADLVERGVDYMWVPNILNTEPIDDHPQNHVCPWGQTLPYVLRQSPPLRNWRGRLLCPTLRFKDGVDGVRDAMVRAVRELGIRKSVARRAFDAGYAALQRFRDQYAQAGSDALTTLIRNGESGMVMVGRPYNIHDPGVSLSVARKLRENYGVNVLPVDCLPLKGIDFSDVNDNMFWAYGKRILAAAKLVERHPNLHIIYITNFKCGPDSFIKGFIRPASGKPFLTLQFDGHSNDAGMMTRCEAYLDSKGILRWWRTCKSKPVSEVLPAEPSISPKCPTPLRG